MSQGPADAYGLPHGLPRSVGGASGCQAGPWGQTHPRPPHRRCRPPPCACRSASAARWCSAASSLPSCTSSSSSPTRTWSATECPPAASAAPPPGPAPASAKVKVCPEHPPPPVLPPHLLLSAAAAPSAAETPRGAGAAGCPSRRLDGRGRGRGASLCRPAALAPLPLWRTLASGPDFRLPFPRVWLPVCPYRLQRP